MEKDVFTEEDIDWKWIDWSSNNPLLNLCLRVGLPFSYNIIQCVSVCLLVCMSVHSSVCGSVSLTDEIIAKMPHTTKQLL